MKSLTLLPLTISFLIPSTALSNITIGNANVTYILDGVYSSNFGKGVNSTYTQVDKINSYRLYDSDKDGPWTSNNNDSLMCWTHAASNSIQYWQDVYGVFYKDKGNMAASGSSSSRVLPNGHYNTTWITDYSTIINDAYAEVEINNPSALNIAKAFLTTGTILVENLAMQPTGTSNGITQQALPQVVIILNILVMVTAIGTLTLPFTPHMQKTQTTLIHGGPLKALPHLTTPLIH